MNRVIKLSFVILALGFSTFLVAEPQEFNERVFNIKAFEQIKQQNKDKQWLMLLWSVDCPPCFKELKIIQELSKTKPDLAVVIINTDDNNEVSQHRQEIINNYHLDHLSHYYFAEDQGDQSRYIVDPTWYGELPRSYFIDANGKFHGRSGLVSKSLLTQWLIASNTKIIKSTLVD
jgi:thiol-disulfide isomerase/thioredoxin